MSNDATELSSRCSKLSYDVRKLYVYFSLIYNWWLWSQIYYLIDELSGYIAAIPLYFNTCIDVVLSVAPYVSWGNTLITSFKNRNSECITQSIRLKILQLQFTDHDDKPNQDSEPMHGSAKLQFCLIAITYLDLLNLENLRKAFVLLFVLFVLNTK